jgi:hypothetical protein
METQVLVRPGTPVDGKKGCFTDGEYTWWNIRVPKSADSDPSFKDYPIDWPLDLYAEAIGCTGWNWVGRKSEWVGFDFDAITGHAAGVGVDDQQLALVKEKAQALPYVEVRKSTGGLGLHLYVHIESVPTENHTVHAGLARAVLSMMSAETGFDFASRIDCCGGNMWIWRKNLTPESTGLQLIKAADCKVKLPANWRDNIEVVSKKRSKVAVPGGIESLAEARKMVSLDDEHRALMEALEDLPYRSEWLQDHNLLQTHTKALESIYLEQSPPIRGLFSTSSLGNHPDSPNCFMFPVDGGGWRVYRFSPGVSEATTWVQDGKSWTTCDFNMTPTLRAACLVFGGVEDDRNGTFTFNDQGSALKAMAALGQCHSFPAGFESRVVSLGQSKDGRLTIAIKKEKDDIAPTGYVDVKSSWRQVAPLRLAEPEAAPEREFDNVVRQLVSPAGSSAGWMIRSDDGRWREASKDDCKSVLISHEVTKKELDAVLGRALRKPWKLVTRPFEAEFPGDRQWNRGAAQLAFAPATTDVPAHPHWDMVLTHAGGELDDALKECKWAKAAGMTSGKQYLAAWIASMIRCPFEPLPYLFFFGPENSGKSIFHEAIAQLLTAGVVDANRSLKDGNDFNGELENAVLCYIEERDLSKQSAARNKIKDWVTAKRLSIRRMRVDQYTQLNTTHWVHCANEQRYCPIFPGDTRITMIYVPSLAEGAEIPKSTLLEKLKEEAPDFLRTLLDLELPKVEGRLRIPTVETEDKQEAADAAKSPWQRFRDERLDSKPGNVIPLVELNKCFQDWAETRKLPRPNNLTKRDLDAKPNPICNTKRNAGRVVLDVCFATAG